MAKLILSDLANLQNETTAVTTMATNNSAIETAMEKTLSRDGTSPNAMAANLDMDSNRILNLPEPVADQEPVRKVDISGATLSVLEAYKDAAEAAQAAAEIAQTSAETAETNAETAETNAETAETNAEAAKTAAEAAQAAAEIAQAAAELSEDNAALSESSASTSASTATTQAGIATTQAGIATTQASNASTSASTATTQAGIATAAAAAAAISADGLDDIYLGSKSSDPTLDNDGNALVEGQLYWNSASNTLKVYDGATWNGYSPSTGVSGPGSTTNNSVAYWNNTSGSSLGDPGFSVFSLYRSGGTDVPVADGGTGASTASAALTNLSARGQGKETIFIPAAAMTPRTTNGAANGTVELSTNKIMVRSLDFDATTQEFAQFTVWFPKSWNLGTVTFQPSFSQLTTAAGGVVFGLAAVAISDGDDLDAALGTAQTSTKTAGTLNKEYQGPESSAITIAGTPAAGDRVVFQINRTVADASDTLAQDARLHGVRLFFTTNAATDT